MNKEDLPEEFIQELEEMGLDLDLIRILLETESSKAFRSKQEIGAVTRKDIRLEGSQK